MIVDFMQSFFDNRDEMLAIAAAVLVLFTAILDPRISFALAGLFLVAYAAIKLMAKDSRKKSRRR